MKYDSLEELKLRVGASIIMYGDEPAYVHNIIEKKIDDDFAIAIQVVPGGPKILEISQSDKKITLIQRLGYVNYGKTTVYMTRMPTRRYKAGLYNENVSIQISPMEQLQQLRPGFSNIYKDPAFKDAVQGKYKSLEVVEELCRKGDEALGGERRTSVAISRHLSVFYDDFRKDFILLHRNAPVGFGKPGRFSLIEEYKHLSETLSNKGIKCVA